MNSTPTLQELLLTTGTALGLADQPEQLGSASIAALGIDSLSLLQLSLELEQRHGWPLDLDRVSSETLLSELLQDYLTGLGSGQVKPE
jgi:acyl carrier protein